MNITQVTKQVSKVVVVDEPTGEHIISISEPEYRRIGRIVLAYVEGKAPHVGPKTRAAAAEFVAGLGYNAENTATR